ncbi:MAG: alginate export family protein [Opitutae bacterium]|nr:alginate export family protein [Opitutae bacterium]
MSITAAPAASTPAPAKDWTDEIRQPSPDVTLGADLRIRDEYLSNTSMGMAGSASLTNQIRIRSRFWTGVKLCDTVSLNGRLTSEMRQFTHPPKGADGKIGASGGYRIGRFDYDEIIADSLTVKWTKMFGEPLTLTAGRQDIILGNGWIVCDGTPRDGSRTLFFDAARFNWDHAASKTVFDLVLMNNSAAPDRFIAPLEARDFRQYLSEQNEQGVVLYATNKSIAKTQLDGYFVYKHDQPVYAFASTGAARFPTSAGEIYAPGARIVTDINANWRARAEAAVEFGHKNSQDLRAYGFNSQLLYSLKDDLNNRLRLGYECLSGDDAGTARKNERWDPLWGRWPQVSELLIYNPTVGPRPFEWGNFQRINIGYSASPCKKAEFSMDYNAFFALEKEPVRGTLTSGNQRGQLFSAMVEYTYNRHVRGHLRAEYFWPGDYYDRLPAILDRGVQTFLRAEIYLTF